MRVYIEQQLLYIKQYPAILAGILLLMGLPIWKLGLAEIGWIALDTRPVGNDITDLSTQHPTLVHTCEDTPHQLPPYPTTIPDYPQNYINEDRVPAIGSLLQTMLDGVPPIRFMTHFLIYEPLYLAAQRSRAVGNDHAADNLEHFLKNHGHDITNYDVDTLLQELPDFHQETIRILNSSIGSLVDQRFAPTSPTPCQQFNNTTHWLGVGYRSQPIDLFPHIDNTLSIGSEGFYRLYAEPNYADRDEFDIYLAMNPIYYSLGQSVTVDSDTQHAEVCYRVFLYFPYVWYYHNTGFVDFVMATLDATGFTESYNIYGASEVYCKLFHRQNDIVGYFDENGTQRPLYNFSEHLNN